METPGDCLVDDDMKELMLKFINSDLVIMATPGLRGQRHCRGEIFLERLIPFSDPHFEYDENGETRPAGGKDNPPMAIIATCAFPEQSQLDIIEDIFHRVSRSFHTRVVAEIFRGEAALLRESPRDAEASVAEYWSLVQRAGREVAQKMKISADTALRLEEPLMPYDQYVREANVHWDKIMATMKKQS